MSVTKSKVIAALIGFLFMCLLSATFSGPFSFICLMGAIGFLLSMAKAIVDGLINQ